MAEGRMIVKGIGRDPRIRGLSETAQRLWPYVLPHTEFGGILPREAHELRLACFPEWKLTDEQVEASIIEWLKTKPPMAQEITTRGGNKRLALTDFGKCNEHLVFNAERQRRWREKHKVTLRTVSNGSNGSNGRSEEKRSEEKRRELKQQQQIVPTIDQVVTACRELKYDVDPKDWHAYWTAMSWKDKNGLLICWKDKLKRRAYYIGKEKQGGAPAWRCDKCMVYHVKAIPCPPGAPLR